MVKGSVNLVIVGSSAGGPRILRELFDGLPRINASVVAIQHMPKFVNHSLCENLSRYTECDVILAVDNTELKPGNIYVAPSEKHLVLEQNRLISLVQGEKVNFACPSIDVTMQSVLQDPSRTIWGIILTGMGRDGAEGISHIKQIGGTTIAQDEETSIIFGMPREAIKTGQVDHILSPAGIRTYMIKKIGIL
jgi:two-component system chemotaxis response regulator CheB